MARKIRRTTTLAALAALTATGVALSGCTAGSGDEGGDGQTLKLWHYEGADSAMGKAWAEAISIFEEETGATVEFEEKSFEQSGKVGSFLRATYYLPQILPIAVAGIVIGWIVRPGGDGALNQILGAFGIPAYDWLGQMPSALIVLMVVMVWVQLGYPVVVFMAALQRVDPELYEAAELDGANWFQRFSAITMSIIRPEIFVVTLTCTIAALKVFGPVYIITRGGPAGSTLVPAYYAYQEFFTKRNVGYGATIATVLTIVVVIVSIIFIRVQNSLERKERAGL
ncbi:ABC transporter permease subunit [Microbacterium sp. NPDC089695]|uniref:carbohydrate ABC transporter permease n=1 Tax=Microbacterium sp. NPDC089695 TaxID=3364198 RepID=UPI0037F83596